MDVRGWEISSPHRGGSNNQNRTMSMGLMGLQPLPSTQRELKKRDQSRDVQTSTDSDNSSHLLLSPSRRLHGKTITSSMNLTPLQQKVFQQSSYLTPSGADGDMSVRNRGGAGGPVVKSFTASRVGHSGVSQQSSLINLEPKPIVTESPSLWNRLFSWATPKRETKEQETQSEDINQIDSSQIYFKQQSPSKVSIILFQNNQMTSTHDNLDLDSLPTSPIRSKTTLAESQKSTIESQVKSIVEADNDVKSHKPSGFDVPDTGVAVVDRIGGLVSASSGVFSDDMTVHGGDENEFISLEQEPLPDDLFDRTITLDMTVPVSDIIPTPRTEEPSLHAEIQPPSAYVSDEEAEDLSKLTKPFSLSTSSSVEGLHEYQLPSTSSSLEASPVPVSAKEFGLDMDISTLNLNQTSTTTALTMSSEIPPPRQHFDYIKSTPSKPPANSLSSTTFQMSSNSALAEFDPLGSTAAPHDWMMTFESPSIKQNTSRVTGSGSNTSLDLMGASQHPVTPRQMSLLDTIEPVATPNSIVKYSQRDMDNLKKQLQENFEKEFEVAQLELQELESQKQELMVENQKMKHTLAQWEQAVQQMIAEKEQDQALHEQEKIEIREQVSKTVEERDRLKKELDYMNLKYKQLRIDMSDLREVEEKQREHVQTLESDVAAANQRFETLRVHAESKLEEANVKIASVRSSHEKEIAALKSKLSRLEVQSQALDRNLKAKIQENEELSKICDGLVAQIEQIAGQS